jgi:hypothetical protein
VAALEESGFRVNHFPMNALRILSSLKRSCITAL